MTDVRPQRVSVHRTERHRRSSSTAVATGTIATPPASIFTNPVYRQPTRRSLADACAQRQASPSITKMLVLAAPEQGPLLVARTAQGYCAVDLPSSSVIAYTCNMGGYDGQVGPPQRDVSLSSYSDSIQLLVPRACAQCATNGAALNLTNWFETPKPSPSLKQPSGERLKSSPCAMWVSKSASSLLVYG